MNFAAHCEADRAARFTFFCFKKTKTCYDSYVLHKVAVYTLCDIGGIAMKEANISTKQGNRLKQKASWFAGTTFKQDNITSIMSNITEFPFYAFAMHDSRDEGKENHIHFVLNCKGSRSIKSICDTLDCDYTVVQKAERPRSCIRYLIHADNQDKYQYAYDEIFTNNPDRLSYYFSSFTYTINDMYRDFESLSSGMMSVDEFLDRYKSEISTLPFYQKIKILEVLKKITFYK